jgi:hypothetical protein
MRFSGTAVLGVAIGAFALGAGTGVMTVKSGRELVTSMFRSERKADALRPKSVDRPLFRFQYPGNWRIDVDDKDYDPDHSFTVESPGESMVMFQIADGELDPEPTLQTYADAQASKLVKSATRTPFTTWGKHTGKGVTLRGKMLGLVPGSARIFCFQARGQTFVIIEHTYDDDRASVQPAFDLIERTFEVNEH